MSQLANISGREAIRAFERAGFRVVRTRGDHVYLDNGTTTISVPNHRNVKVGTLRSIIRQAGMTVDAFLDLV